MASLKHKMRLISVNKDALFVKDMQTNINITKA
jgi:hypothetical protein